MAVVIAPFESADRAAVASLWFDSFLSAGLSHDADTTPARLAERLTAEIAGGWSVWTAKDAGSLLGFLAFNPGTAVLHQLFVGRAAQNRGVGRALLHFAMDRMPKGFRLRAHAQNAGAQRFYLREGMILDRFEAHPRYGHQTAVFRWP